MTINGIPLSFETESGLFSPDGIDRGTLAMLSTVSLTATDKLLDLGCGYGVVGIYAAKVIGGPNVVMSDVDETSVRYAQTNAAANQVTEVKIVVSDGFDSLTDTGFTYILSNPPYHTDFSVAKRFIEKGFNRLALGGKMVMVTKRKDWYQHKLTAIFGGVSVKEVDGYYVFHAEKRRGSYANLKGRDARK
ncbi:MAG: methyltransferase [Clostridiales bacterium]|nr:methyltransferase [Clostridiales bacterium]